MSSSKLFVKSQVSLTFETIPVWIINIRNLPGLRPPLFLSGRAEFFRSTTFQETSEGKIISCKLVKLFGREISLFQCGDLFIISRQSKHVNTNEYSWHLICWNFVEKKLHRKKNSNFYWYCNNAIQQELDKIHSSSKRQLWEKFLEHKRHFKNKFRSSRRTT